MNRVLLSFLLATASIIPVCAQETNKSNLAEPGGLELFYKLLRNSIRYPHYAGYHDINRRIYVDFRLDNMGKPERIVVYNDPHCDFVQTVETMLKTIGPKLPKNFLSKRVLLPMKFKHADEFADFTPPDSSNFDLILSEVIVICYCGLHRDIDEGVLRFYEYLEKNLIFPKSLHGIYIEKYSLMMSLQIDQAGKISNVVFLNHVEKLLATEVLRVVGFSHHQWPKNLRGKNILIPVEFSRTFSKGEPLKTSYTFPRSVRRFNKVDSVLPVIRIVCHCPLKNRAPHSYPIPVNDPFKSLSF